MMRAPGITSLEQQFQGYVLRARPGIERSVVATAQADALVRLKVYADAYRLRLLEVLGKDYPALRKLVGDAGFSRLGRAYIDAHPSDTPSVRWFGRHLAVFLRKQAAFRRRPVLAEMAEFEWRQAEAFDAPDAAVISMQQVTSIPAGSWAHMRLALHPSLRRLDLVWNVPVLWQALQTRRKARRKPRATVAPAAWLLWRSGLEVRWRSLAADEAAALDAVAAGETFAQVCERLSARIAADQLPLHAAGLLKRWVADGLVAAIKAG